MLNEKIVPEMLVAEVIVAEATHQTATTRREAMPDDGSRIGITEAIERWENAEAAFKTELLRRVAY